MKTGIQVTPLYDIYRSKTEMFRENRLQLSSLLEKNNVKYGAWTLSFEIAPAILDETELKTITLAVENIIRGAEIVTDKIIESPEIWRKHFNWSDNFFTLALIEPGYSFNIPCARFDMFLNNGELTFLELNTDGCSGMTNADIFHSLYKKTVQTKSELQLKEYKIKFVVPHLLNVLCSCYDEFRANFPLSKLPEKPVVGILDVKDEDTHWEFTAVADALANIGLKAVIVTPDNASFDGQKLRFDDTQVHLIYRRLLGTDYAEQYDKLIPVTDAFKQRKICMVGAPRSQFAFSKKLFAFMQEPEIQSFFPAEVSTAINNHLPWTRIFGECETDYFGKSINLVTYIRDNKDLFVLKPCESKCGFGIYQGKFCDQNKWNEAVETALKEDYIVQKFINLPTGEFPRFSSQQLTEKRYIHLGGYAFGNKFSGFLGRTCASPLLTLIHGERLLPVLSKSPKSSG